VLFRSGENGTGSIQFAGTNPGYRRASGLAIARFMLGNEARDGLSMASDHNLLALLNKIQQ
jgi:hypothetical protein